MKDSFIVNFALHLWLAHFGIAGPLADLISFFGTRFLGSLLDRGILVIDLTLDSIKLALKEDQYRKLAEAAYKKAIAKVYTEGEKDEVRKQYLDALRDFARVGRVRDDGNT